MGEAIEILQLGIGAMVMITLLPLLTISLPFCYPILIDEDRE